MKKINVTGNAGVGKSTISKMLGEVLGLEVICLDKVVWASGWKKVPKDLCKKRLQEIANRDAWIVDGVSKEIRNVADTIVFLDFPRRVSLWRCTKRIMRYLFKTRPDLPSDCPEILVIPKLLKIVYQFPSKMRGKILKEFEENEGKKNLYHIKNEKDIEACFASIRLKCR